MASTCGESCESCESSGSDGAGAMSAADAGAGDNEEDEEEDDDEDEDEDGHDDDAAGSDGCSSAEACSRGDGAAQSVDIPTATSHRTYFAHLRPPASLHVGSLRFRSRPRLECTSPRPTRSCASRARREAATQMSFSFAIDRGGTFTDVCALTPDGRLVTLKLLSEDPASYADAPTEGIRRILEAETGEPHPRGAPVPTARIASIRMGTTVATNALLERRGAPTLLVVTRGFGDLLHIGNQSRPRIFDLEIASQPALYREVLEVDERLVLCQGEAERLRVHEGREVVTGSTGERLVVEAAPDIAPLRAALSAARARGATSCAVARGPVPSRIT